MKKTLLLGRIGLVLLLMLAPLGSSLRAEEKTKNDQEEFVRTTPSRSEEEAVRDTAWDVNLELGYFRFASDEQVRFDRSGAFFGRIQGGRLWINGSFFLGAGPFIDWVSSYQASVGILGSIVNLKSSLWFEAGTFRSFQPAYGYFAALGWNAFGVEFQNRAGDPPETSCHGCWVFKVRVPIGILFYEIAEK